MVFKTNKQRRYVMGVLFGKRKPVQIPTQVNWDFEQAGRDGYKVVWMRPQQYLNRVKLWNPEKKEWLQTTSDIETGREIPITKLNKILLSGKKITIPIIEKEAGITTIPNHEGRHRAFSAKLIGERLMPVRVERPKGSKDRIFKEFMATAFPHEPTTSSYYKEWRGRFNRPFPEQRMDINTTKIYQAVLKKNRVQ